MKLVVASFFLFLLFFVSLKLVGERDIEVRYVAIDGDIGIVFDEARDYRSLHNLALRCLKESNSPHGYRDIPMHTREERIAEYERILSITAEFRLFPGYRWGGWAGPWTEEVFIQKFCCNRSIETFGPFIPVFVPWTNVWKKRNTSRSRVGYPETVRPLFQALRPDFLYVTVNHNDYGIGGMRRSTNPDVPANLFIISASGLGHVPILLHKAPMEWVDPLPPENLICFLGRSVRWKRQKVLRAWKGAFGERMTMNASVPDWVDFYRRHSLILSPRGNARGCFRTAEILELGLVPIIAFRRRPWVPYLNSTLPWGDIAFIACNSDIPQLAPIINGLTEERLSVMRQNIRKYKHTHFTMEATMKQIGRFLQTGYSHSDLRCAEYYDEY